MKFHAMWWEWYLLQTEMLYDYFNEYDKTLKGSSPNFASNIKRI